MMILFKIPACLREFATIDTIVFMIFIFIDLQIFDLLIPTFL
jgi:hypothetical protein